ncbi:MAG: cation-translocating P-type ATPase C-terminal domain-containing protein, partial [Actinomycetota bacterium]
ALGAEGAEPDIMKRPPRSRRERLIDMAMLARTWLFLGLIEAALVMGGFFWVLYSQGWQYGQELDATSNLYMQATTMTFAGIVATQVGTAIACRTNRVSVLRVGFWSNRWLLWGIGFEIILLFLIVYVPVLQDMFKTAGLEWQHWLVLAAFAPVILVSDELRKFLLRRMPDRTMRGGTS